MRPQAHEDKYRETGRSKSNPTIADIRRAAGENAARQGIVTAKVGALGLPGGLDRGTSARSFVVISPLVRFQTVALECWPSRARIRIHLFDVTRSPTNS
jgi:hypothetical protein